MREGEVRRGNEGKHWREHNKWEQDLWTSDKVSTVFLSSAVHTSLARLLFQITRGGKNFPTSLEISISVLCKCGKRIPVSPSFSVMPSLLEPTLLSLLAGRLERLKMFYLCVVVLGYASIHIYEWGKLDSRVWYSIWGLSFLFPNQVPKMLYRAITKSLFSRALRGEIPMSHTEEWISGLPSTLQSLSSTITVRVLLFQAAGERLGCGVR